MRIERSGPGSCGFCGPEKVTLVVSLGDGRHARQIVVCPRCVNGGIYPNMYNAANLTGRGTCCLCEESVTPAWYLFQPQQDKRIIATAEKTPRLVQFCVQCARDLNGTNLLRNPDLLSGACDAIEWVKPPRDPN